MATFYKRMMASSKYPVWYFQYFDESGKRITKRGCTDKAATEALARKLEEEVWLRKEGVIDERLDRYAKEGRKPICDHLSDWKNNMLSRDVTEKHITMSHNRIEKLIKIAGITSLSDVTTSKIQLALGHLRDKGRAPKTLNEYLHSMKQFMSWCKSDGRIMDNPISTIRGYNVNVDRRHLRRALSDEELVKLFTATENSGVHQNCTGPERALIYRLAVLTGLRANEISTLTVNSFKLMNETPYIIVEAAFSKHRRKDEVLIPQELLQPLINFFDGKNPQEKAFKVPIKTWKAMQYDLENAGIPYYVEGEGFADFHALRHTYVTRLVMSNASPKIVQKLARHSDAQLTLNVYAHVDKKEQQKAVNNLPSLFNTALIED